MEDKLSEALIELPKWKRATAEKLRNLKKEKTKISKMVLIKVVLFQISNQNQFFQILVLCFEVLQTTSDKMLRLLV